MPFERFHLGLIGACLLVAAAIGGFFAGAEHIPEGMLIGAVIGTVIGVIVAVSVLEAGTE